MRSYDEFVKIAKTKVQKMVDTGKIKDNKLLDRIFFEKPEIKNNVNNRINARAQRAAGAVKKTGRDISRAKLSDVTSKPMTAGRYWNLSKPDSLKSRPAIDTNRQLKDMGRENSRVISYANKYLPKGVSIKRKGNEHHAKTDTEWNRIIGLKGADITIPSKKAYSGKHKKALGQKLPNQIARENRAMDIAHEISGELQEQIGRDKAIEKLNLNINNTTTSLFGIGSHASPHVLVKDAKNRKRLSHASQKHDIRVRRKGGNFVGRAGESTSNPIPENNQMNRLIDPNMPKNRTSLPFSQNLKNTDKETLKRMYLNRARQQLGEKSYYGNLPTLSDMVEIQMKGIK